MKKMTLLRCILPCLLACLAVQAFAGSPTGLWIVTLDDPPLAEFSGFGHEHGAEKAALQATAPTGEMLLDPASAASQDYLGYLEREQQSVLTHAAMHLQRGLHPVHRYRIASNGFSAMMDADEAALLRKLPGVLSVEPDTLHELSTDAGPAWIGAPAVWNAQSGVAATRGEGRIIGIIDTGIHWSHPAFAQNADGGYLHVNPRGQFLGLCTSAQAGRCNGKLIGIWDFTEEGLRDGADRDGHGTHVASTAAGNPLFQSFGGAFLSVTGVAPRAHIVSYKACLDVEDMGTRCPSSALLQSIEQAIVDRVDVINYSISGIPVSPWLNLDSGPANVRRAFFNARTSGIASVVAAGNSGPGPGTMTAPGTAPWVVAVANASHNRRLETRLTELSGGSTPPPTGLAGVSISGALTPRRIVWGGDFGSALCSTGNDIDFPPSGASNPWAGQQVFNGEIVVCIRGVQARVAKSFNVQAAGGAGMVLLNDAFDAESIVADPHIIPSVHLGFQDGQRLLQWLGAGSEHRGRITATQSALDDARGDRLAASSSRGPGRPVRGYLKPDISAPGTDILAADRVQGNLTLKTGTSMAAPHVAGAMALLRATHPGWTVNQLESALMTTAERGISILQDGVSPAGGSDVGAGRLRIDRAVRAGLYFPLNPTEMRNANPASGGDPSALNRPSLYSESCKERCSFTRRVRPLHGQGGTWTASLRGGNGAVVNVTPSSFSLAAGQTQTLNFEVDVTAPSLAGAWVDAEVLLSHSNEQQVATTQIPVSVRADPGALPAAIDIAVAANRARHSVVIDGLVDLQPLHVQAQGLGRGSRASAARPGDSDRDNPFRENPNGAFVRLIDIPTGTELLIVEVASTTATAVHLYVGRDNDGEGDVDLRELVCRSELRQPRQSCIVDTPSAGRWWLMAFNHQGSSSGIDTLQIEWAMVSAEQQGSLTATGPGRADAGEPVDMRLFWDQGQMRRGETWYGVLELGPSRERAGQIARIPVRLQREMTHAEHRAQAVLLDQPVTITLAPGQAHERLYIDLPRASYNGPAISSMRVTAQAASGDIALYLAEAERDPGRHEAEAAVPRDQATHESSSGFSSLRQIEFPVTPATERWMITPVNRSASEVTLSVLAEALAEQPVGGFTPPPGLQLLPGDYHNPQRDGHGFNLSQVQDQWLLVWYTYERDGEPTWYVAQADAPGDSSSMYWSAPLLRFVWDGTAAQSSVVGRVDLHLLFNRSILFAWELEAESGSDIVAWLGDRSCPEFAGQTTSLGGHWFAPSLPGYGWTPLAMSNFEGHWLYVYDGHWRPRWVFAETTDVNAVSSGDLLQFRGYCPSCPTQATTSQPVGVMQRHYTTPDTGMLSLDMEFAEPLGGTWNQQRPVTRMSGSRHCATPP